MPVAKMLGLNALTPTIFLDSQQARLLIADVLRSILPVLPCIFLRLASTLSSLTPLIDEMVTKKFLYMEDRLLNGQFRDLLTGPESVSINLVVSLVFPNAVPSERPTEPVSNSISDFLQEVDFATALRTKA